MAKTTRRPRQSAVATSKPIDLAAPAGPAVSAGCDPFEKNRIMLEGLLAMPQKIAAREAEQRRLQAEAIAAAMGKAEPEWYGPMSCAEWAKEYKVDVRTFNRWRTDKKIRVRELSRNMFFIHPADIPGHLRT